MILIKIGGGKNINWNYIAEDICWLIEKEKVVIVHGANSYRDEIAERMGHPTKKVKSESGITTVYTDEKALEIFTMVYAGLVNKKIVALLQSFGINAVGISGIDGKTWVARRKNILIVKEGNKTRLLKDNYSGQVEKINPDLIKILIENNYVPVICPPALSHEYEILNVDNDFACALLASALNIKEIIYLFEAPGFLKDPEDERTLIKKIDKDRIFDCLNFAQGTMKKKILSAKMAIENGVEKIYFGDGRIKNPVQNVLGGGGTIIE